MIGFIDWKAYNGINIICPWEMEAVVKQFIERKKYRFYWFYGCRENNDWKAGS
jgi:hypothetical protein